MNTQDHSRIKVLSESATDPEASSLSSEVPSNDLKQKTPTYSTKPTQSDDTDTDLSEAFGNESITKHPISHYINMGMNPNGTSSIQMEARGYSELASLLASSPSQTSTIFRRFDKLNMRNLLMLENEIADLEMRLEDLEIPKTSNVVPHAEMKTQIVSERTDKITEIGIQLKEKVKEYYEGILLTKEMLALSRPNKANLNATRRMVKNRRAGSPLDVIAGPMSQHLSPEHEEDLSVLVPQQQDDILMRFFNGKFTNNIDGNLSSMRSAHAASFAAALFAALFLIGAIIGLYFVSDTKSRLAMLSTFTLIFAATIALLTNARRQDVFVATAAYAAVLVVFVSGNISERPIPTYCILQAGSGGELSNAALNTAVPQNSVVPTATVTATVVQTVATAQSPMTVFSTVVSNPSATATVIVRKGEMSDLTKTGIGVGVAVGLLFCLMIVGCVILPWLSQKKLSGIWNCGPCSGGRSKRDLKKKVEGGRGIWSFNEKKGVKEKIQNKNVSEESRNGQVIWV